MSYDQKWIEELSTFFKDGDNWSIACETAEAVQEIEPYWKNLFWQHVYDQCFNALDHNLWEVRKNDEEVDIYLKDDEGHIEESCHILIVCDEEDGCWYGIWRKKDNYNQEQNTKIEQFSKRQEFTIGDDSLYKPQVTPYLDKAQLGKEIKNNFEDAKKLAQETVTFIQNSNIQNCIKSLATLCVKG